VVAGQEAEAAVDKRQGVTSSRHQESADKGGTNGRGTGKEKEEEVVEDEVDMEEEEEKKEIEEEREKQGEELSWFIFLR
jgi:hypothetical protein